MRALLRLLQAKRGTALLASPTGKAAKRLAEATGVAGEHAAPPARAWGLAGVFARDAEHPLEADLIVVDEASMLDELLANMLVKAVPSGAHLLFVGDVDQLPSVGLGNVLADLLASEQVAVVRLEVIFRQAAESGIIVNAHRILHGERPSCGSTPISASSRPTIPTRPSTRSATWSARMLPRQRVGLRPPLGARDVQVLTPMRVGRLGSANLNEVLQAAVDPPRPPRAERAFGGRVFRGGRPRDLQMKTTTSARPHQRRQAEESLSKTVDLSAQQVEVVLDDGRVVSYDFADLDELLHAYALSVHRAQGFVSTRRSCWRCTRSTT